MLALGGEGVDELKVRWHVWNGRDDGESYTPAIPAFSSSTSKNIRLRDTLPLCEGAGSGLFTVTNVQKQHDMKGELCIVRHAHRRFLTGWPQLYRSTCGGCIHLPVGLSPNLTLFSCLPNLIWSWSELGIRRAPLLPSLGCCTPGGGGGGGGGGRAGTFTLTVLPPIPSLHVTAQRNSPAPEIAENFCALALPCVTCKCKGCCYFKGIGASDGNSAAYIPAIRLEVPNPQALSLAAASSYLFAGSSQ